MHLVKSMQSDEYGKFESLSFSTLLCASMESMGSHLVVLKLSFLNNYSKVGLRVNLDLSLFRVK